MDGSVFGTSEHWSIAALPRMGGGVGKRSACTAVLFAWHTDRGVAARATGVTKDTILSSPGELDCCVSFFGHVIEVVALSSFYGKEKTIASCLHLLGPACQCSEV